MAENLKFVDRLNDVQDHYFFGGFFIVGIAIMAVLRYWLDAPAIYVSILLVILLLLYAGAVLLTKRYHLREDRSADNLYFLGFLFTVSALIVSLLKFSQNTGADVLQNNPLVVVEDLGIGLITTLVGLFLRVLFTQLRRDPNEIEEEVNLQLTVVAEKVTRNIRSVSELVEDSAVLMGQVYAESQRQLEAQREMANKMFENAESSIRLANEQLVSELRSLAEKVEKVEAPIDLITAKLDPALTAGQSSIAGFSEKIDDLELPANLFTERAARSLPDDLFSRNVQAALPPTIFSDRIAPVFEPLPDLISERVKNLEETTRASIESSLTRITDEVTVLIGNLEVPPDLLADQMRDVFSTLDTLKPLLERGLTETRSLITRHNEALGGNVENVTKLTGALTETSTAIKLAWSELEKVNSDGQPLLRELNTGAKSIAEAAMLFGAARENLGMITRELEKIVVGPGGEGDLSDGLTETFTAFENLRLGLASLTTQLVSTNTALSTARESFEEGGQHPGELSQTIRAGATETQNQT